MFIEITGRVNEKGEVQIEWPPNLPPGQIRVVIEPYDPDAEAAEEARWDASFARSQDVLAKLAGEAHAEYIAGQTGVFEPDDEEA